MFLSSTRDSMLGLGSRLGFEATLYECVIANVPSVNHESSPGEHVDSRASFNFVSNKPKLTEASRSAVVMSITNTSLFHD